MNLSVTFNYAKFHNVPYVSDMDTAIDSATIVNVALNVRALTQLTNLDA